MSNKVGLKVNLPKMKVLTNIDIDDIVMKIVNDFIERVDNYLYLGFKRKWV